MAPDEKSPPELRDKMAVLKSESNRVVVEFLLIDLSVAMGFAESALNQRNSKEKRERNRINARKGYEAVLRFSDRIEMPGPLRQDLTTKLQRLKSDLEQVGERFED